MTRLLGIDLGEKRIGLAIGDTETGAVRPLSTIRRADPERDAATLGRVAAEQRIDELVVGLPLNMDGSEGAQAPPRVTGPMAWPWRSQLPLAWRDERLTSEAAERRVGAARRGRSGGPPSAASRNAQRARVDREAAAAIVQAELDARSDAAPLRQRRQAMSDRYSGRPPNGERPVYPRRDRAEIEAHVKSREKHVAEAQVRARRAPAVASVRRESLRPRNKPSNSRRWAIVGRVGRLAAADRVGRAAARLRGSGAFDLPRAIRT